MSVTITLEITNELLRHVPTHEVSSSGSSLVLAKITYECMWCAHHSNITTAAYVYGHTHTHTHTQFVILINFMNFLTNFNLITCTFQYIHK